MSRDRFCVLHPFTARFCGVMMSLETSEHPPALAWTPETTSYHISFRFQTFVNIKKNFV